MCLKNYFIFISMLFTKYFSFEFQKTLYKPGQTTENLKEYLKSSEVVTDSYKRAKLKGDTSFSEVIACSLVKMHCFNIQKV